MGTLGATALVEAGIDYSIFVQLALVKPRSSDVDSQFLQAMLDTQLMQHEILRQSSQSTMKYIGVGKIAELVVPIPPLEIQNKVAAQVLAVNRKIECDLRWRHSLEALFKSMLHQLMTGQVRAPIP